MRFSFSDWIKNLRYLKRFDIKTFQKTRAIVNTFSFFAVWFYLGYFISKKAEEKQIETGIPHSIQVARISGDKTILKWDLGTGTKQLIGKTNERTTQKRENLRF